MERRRHSVDPRGNDFTAKLKLVAGLQLNHHSDAFDVLAVKPETEDQSVQEVRFIVFVGEHGGWDRRRPVGYNVAFAPFRDGRPAGDPVDFVTGFLLRAALAADQWA